MSKLTSKEPARIQYLVEKILEVCRDMQSARFYARVARALPDDAIFQFLSELKQDEGIRNRGAVFTCKAKEYAKKHGVPL